MQVIEKNKGFPWIKLLLGLILLLALGAALYLLAVMTWSYSNGERAGYVQKFSRKGWVCKTWEGELSMVAMPGSMPEKFAFTVRDDTVANQINALMGKRVALVYDQHVGIPTDCLGETGYFVTAVKAVE